MGNDELYDRLNRVLELMDTADRDGWDAMSRDLALDDLRTVYGALYGVRLVQRVPKGPFTVAATEAIPQVQVRTEAVITAQAVTPEVAVEAFQSETSIESIQEIEENSVRTEPMNAAAPVAADMPAAIQATEPAPAPLRADETEPKILGEKLNKPIADLRTGIPLNEKFGLIKNLFGNNASEFQDAILHLNRCADAQTLMNHLEEMRVMGNWDPEDPYYLQLHSFAERKGAHLLLGQGG